MTGEDAEQTHGDWNFVRVEDCLEPWHDESSKKIAKSSYMPAGQFPIVDQGSQLIAGWTDDQEAVIDDGLPLVVFGDHTRALKFVDFPFVRGADGTQLLRTSKAVDTRFFYYACRHLDLPSRGYNRHFSLLREQSIALPNAIEVQRDIADSLAFLEAAIELEGRLVETAEELKVALLNTAFTKGLRGAPQQDTGVGLVPGGWVEVRLAELGDIVTGTTPPTKHSEYYTGGQIPFITPGDLEHGRRIDKAKRHLTPAGLEASRSIPGGSTSVVCIGSTIGKVGLVSAGVSATNQQINSIVPGETYDPRYVFYGLVFHADAVRREATRGPVPLLSKGAFEQLAIHVTPDAREQAEIANALESVDAKVDHHRIRQSLLTELFGALLRQLMAGELPVQDLNLAAIQSGSRSEEAVA